jgi:hypothetical protein
MVVAGEGERGEQSCGAEGVDVGLVDAAGIDGHG